MLQIPQTFKTVFQTNVRVPYQGENISCIFEPYGQGLPKFTTEDTDGQIVDKTYKVPASFAINKILEYLYHNLEVKNSILDT